MRIGFWLSMATLFAVLTGCATSRTVAVGQLAPVKKMTTAALVPQDGNSPEMDLIVQQQLAAYGIAAKPALPAGTRKSPDVDLIVAYADIWRWDMGMYLLTITVNMFDAASGNLLVTGRWDNSPFHGFQDARDVVKELLDDMTGKLAAVQ